MNGCHRRRTEWKEDRERLEGRLRRVIGMAGRIPYLCAEQLGEIMGMMMAGLIGYYGRGIPLDDATCRRVVGVQEYVARVRGFGTGRPHLMLYEEVGGLGWTHPYEYAAATLFTQVDEILLGTGTPARTALMAVMGQVAHKLGCREEDPIEWRPDHLEGKLGQDCLIERHGT